MANSRFAYVRDYEEEYKCLKNCFIVIRIDGKNFHRFVNDHNYEKPNDPRGLGLIRCAAINVLSDFVDTLFAYAQSDEISFVLDKKTKIFKRRYSKILSSFVSLFSSSFTFYWDVFFKDQPLKYPPVFDGRIILYPSISEVKDYLSWRQADCIMIYNEGHINNLYNTCFWKLVIESRLSDKEAAATLKDTLSSDKNELLFSKYSLNYNDVPAEYRKGSFICKASQIKTLNLLNDVQINTHPSIEGYLYLFTDVIGETFWNHHFTSFE